MANNTTKTSASYSYKNNTNINSGIRTRQADQSLRLPKLINNSNKNI